MKRKATNSLGAESPTKISKEPIDGSDNHAVDSLESPDAVKEASQRLTSGRQRKAPAWLASYVTDGSTAVKESPKAAKSKVSTLSSPGKKKAAKSSEQLGTEDTDRQVNVDEEPSSLRRGSTLKVEDSPPRPTKNKKSPNTLAHSSSLVRKDTEILSSSASDSCDSATESSEQNTTIVTNLKSLVPHRLDKSPMSKPSQSSNMHSSQIQTLPKVKPKVPSKPLITPKSSVRVSGVDADEFSSSNVMEVCNTLSAADALNGGTRSETTPDLEAGASLEGMEQPGSARKGSGEQEKPKMLEIVICISTSGAMRDFLAVLQEKTRDLVWRLQSLIPDLRIGVLAHTQGGIHDDKPGSGSSAIDHNYIRTGGHSGTKWLDLGATFSQICAFVDSLEPEATIYPDYVQDNLEMSLWKLQRCMSWSSCSYRTVVVIGRGRPNRTSFYLQREHWRGWIRSALEIGQKSEIPVIDWELEAKLLAQMGIHVFTIQASSPKTLAEEEEDEGSVFFRRVAEITNGQHIRLTEANNLVDIIVGVCCACHGPDLLQTHRDTLRDENDGVLPSQLKDVFVSLQLHSKRRSLSTLPSLVGDLSILQSRLAKADANGNINSSEEEEASEDDGKHPETDNGQDETPKSAAKSTTKGQAKSQSSKASQKPAGNKQKLEKKNNTVTTKSGRKATTLTPKPGKVGNVTKKATKAVKGVKAEKKVTKIVPVNKSKANKAVIVNKKNVTKLKKESLKEKIVKKVKVAAKEVPVKNKNLKAVTNAALKKKKQINAKSVASAKKSKKVNNLSSNTNNKAGTQGAEESELPQAVDLRRLDQSSGNENPA